MKRIYTIIILCCCSQRAFAQSTEWKPLTLPGSIETKQIIKEIPLGWETSTTHDHNLLAGVSVYDGKPENKVSLVPNSEERQESKNILIATWRFDYPAMNGFWITVSCASTSITLIRSLPEGIRGFRVIYNTSVTVSGMYEILRAEYR